MTIDDLLGIKPVNKQIVNIEGNAISSTTKTSLEATNGLNKTALNMDVLQSQSTLSMTKKPLTQLDETKVMKLWRAKPKYYFRDVMDVELDLWQEEVVELYLTHNRVGMIASKGPGKTAVLALLCLHMASTNYRPKIACLAISKDHLMSNFWAEMLMRIDESQYLKQMFTTSQQRINMIGAENIAFIDARSFPKSADANQMASTLAGLHANNVGYFIDEGGRIPDAVISTADAALAGGDGPGKMARMVIAANPEEPSGLLYRASIGDTVQKWGIYRVNGDPDNPKRAPRVSVDWAKEQIATYGRDNPWVQINVFGEYPKSSSTKLLSEMEVIEAMRRSITEQQVRGAQMRGSADVARGGADLTVLTRRKGLKVYPQEFLSSQLDGPELAGVILTRHNDNNYERFYIDNTGGYGSSSYDQLKHVEEMTTVPVVYNASAQDPRFANKRAEMYFRLRDWVKAGGCLPYDEMLKEELCAIETRPHGGKIMLLDKAQIKAMIGRSPDRADSLAQTFADPEMRSSVSETFDSFGNRIENISKFYSSPEDADEDYKINQRHFHS
jgi:phage terminase large subunit